MSFALHQMLQDLPLLNILDVGAMSLGGASAYQKLVDHKKARVIGFEPGLEECRKLNERMGPPHIFYPFFIGDGAPATYYETNHVMTGSLYRPNTGLLEMFQNLAELTAMVQTHEVETRRLDDIEGIGCVDFIKMDVQGSELNVFKGASKALETALAIQVEVEFVELYQGQPMFSDVDKYLRGKGYQFHTFLGFGKRCFKPVVVNDNVNDGLNQYLWSDAVYVKDWMRLEHLSTVQLKKYAVLLHDLFRSADLCHLLLSRIDGRDGTDLAGRYLHMCGGGS